MEFLSNAMGMLKRLPGGVQEGYKGLRNYMSAQPEVVQPEPTPGPAAGSQTVEGRTVVPQEQMPKNMGSPTVSTQAPGAGFRAPPTQNIYDTISTAARDSGMTPREVLPNNERVQLSNLGQTVQQAQTEAQALGAQAQQPRAGSTVPKLTPEQAAAARAPITPEGVAAAEARAAGAAAAGAVPPAGTPPAGTPPAGATPNKPGRLRAAGGFLGRLATPGAVIAGAYDQLQHGAGNTDDEIGLKLATNRVKQLDAMDAGFREGAKKVADRIGLQGVFGGSDMSAPDTAGREEAVNRYRAVYGNTIGLARRIGNAFDPRQLLGQEGRMGNQLGGAIADILQGNALGTTQFEPDARQAVAPQPQPPTTPDQQTAARQSAASTPAVQRPVNDPGEQYNGNYISRNGGPKVPVGGGGLRSGTFDGFGKMRADATPEEAANYLRATNAINQQRAAANAQNSQQDQDRSMQILADGFRANGSTGMGAMAAMGGLGAIQRMQSNEQNRGLRERQINTTNDMARARLGFDMNKDARDYATGRSDKQLDQFNKDRDVGNTQQQQGREGNTKRWEKTFRDQAELETPTSIGITDKTREAEVKIKEGTYRSRAEYSVGKTGQRLDDLDSRQQTQLMDAMNFQNKVVDARGTIRQGMKDYIGNNRTDTKNAYNFLPAITDDKGNPVAATRDPGGAIRVATVGGNTIAVKAAAGGGFNLWSTNDPIDADMLKLMMPQINELMAREAAAAKKGK